MSTPTREPCEFCDRPKPTPDEIGHPDGCDCERCSYACWRGMLSVGHCPTERVDWRARCLQAEAALSILSAPLSPEALQALVEESAE